MARAATPSRRLSLGDARALWRAAQGLPPGAPTREPAALVTETGWLRTLGGVEVYLGLRARAPGLRRAAIDAAAASEDLQQIPAVRGCIYAVPRPQAPLALAIAADQALGRLARDLEKAGVSESEMSTVEAATLEVLRAGPQTTDGLRKALPAGTLRGLGEAGKKLGLSSALPPALRRLEFAGRVRRSLIGNRFDTERYTWHLADPVPDPALPVDKAGREAALAALFFRWAAPASLADFVAWSGLSVSAAKKAVAGLDLLPVAVEGYAEEAWMPADAAPDGVEHGWTFLPFEDNLPALHGGAAPLVEARHHGFSVPVWGQTRGNTLGDARHIQGRLILHGDVVAGLWELDLREGAVVAALLEAPSAREREALEAEASGLARFVSEELGHARSFSLDTDETVAGRVATLRGMEHALTIR